MRTIRGVVAAALLASVAVPAAARAAGPTVLTCHVDETRHFAPPLGAVGGDAPYTFTASGTVTCSGVADGTPAVLTGAISVGNTFETADPSCGAAVWQEPAGELFGTAASNVTSETRFVRWDDGGVTILRLDNTDVAWLKEEGSRSGTAVSSATVSAGGACASQPSSLTVAATRAVGAEVRGALWAFNTDEPCDRGCPSYHLVGADVIAP
jgi:hypothetical protein